MPISRSVGGPTATQNFTNAAFPYGAPKTTTTTSSAASKATAQQQLKPVTNNIPKRSTSTTAKTTTTSASTAQQPIKLSQSRYDTHKCADPFATSNKKCKTSFSQSYIQGNIPCRLQSSASKYALQWDVYAADGFSPDLLLVCSDGLTETVHPHCLMAPMMFEELLGRTQGVSDMLNPCFVAVVGNLRKALLDTAAMAAGVKATLQLVQHANGQQLLPQLTKLVPALAQALRGANAKKYQDQVMMIFGLLEQHCGPDATKMIKAKIPTYS